MSVTCRCDVGITSVRVVTPRNGNPTSGGSVKTSENCVSDSAWRTKLPFDWGTPTLRSALMRAFVAIDLPDHVREELRTLQQGLRIGRLVTAENLHLTLSFLGEQSDEAIHEAHQALSTVRMQAFDLRFAGVGALGGRLPRVIVADVVQCDALNELEQRISRSLRSAGLNFSRKRFRPHVTLARLTNALSEFDLAEVRAYLAGHAGFQGSWFTVTRYTLYQSTLRREGALHEVLASYDLTATQN